MKRWLLLPILLAALRLACAEDVPANTWVRIADCPGDAEGREVPPGRGACWGYCPPLKGFLRYGGYTPRFSNAMDLFEPASKKWTRLIGEDETYPLDRPGGLCDALVAWDETRKCVWIAGGVASVNTGHRGIWKYEPESKKFTIVGDMPPVGARRFAFDAKGGLFLASPPPSCDGGGSQAWVFTLAAGKWENKPMPKGPQATYRGHFPVAFDEAAGKFVCVGMTDKTFDTWTMDPATFSWELATSSGPPERAVFTLAYDPNAKMVMLHGGSNGRDSDNGNPGTRIWTDTWFFDAAKKEWIEVKTPGPPSLQHMYNHKPVCDISYRCALANDPERKCMLLSDPDLGVWAFRYGPGATPGSAESSAGLVPLIGKAAKNPPADGPKDIRLKLPTEPNKRLANLPANSITRLKGSIIGNEISWCYDSDHGVFWKYGGCGNHTNPYWEGYGNDLSFYDVGTEQFYTRRTGDISGAARPGNGCTRSLIYDTKRKLLWIFGGVGSGPYCPAPADMGHGSFAYDVDKDQIMLVPPKDKNGPDSLESVTYITYDPLNDVFLKPLGKQNMLFDPSKAVWMAKPCTDLPYNMYNYQTMAYVPTLKGIFRFADVPTGKTSAEKPADALPPGQAAGKAANYWAEDKEKKLWTEFTMKTCVYDAAKNTWTDLKPPANPTFRNSKYGMAYDSKNDVVVMIGGSIGWNGPHCHDLWAYDAKKNTWEKLAPHFEGKPFQTDHENLMTGYDARHGIIVFKSQNVLWAYKYK